MKDKHFAFQYVYQNSDRRTYREIHKRNMYFMLQKFPKEFNLRQLFILNTRSLEINFCVHKQANGIGVPCEFHPSFMCVLLFIIKQSYAKSKTL
jgi:hypothetical protein